MGLEVLAACALWFLKEVATGVADEVGGGIARTVIQKLRRRNREARAAVDDFDATRNPNPDTIARLAVAMKDYASQDESFRQDLEKLVNTARLVALNDFNESLEQYESVPVLIARGKLYRRMRRLDEAARDLNRALELEPENASALRNRGAVLFALAENEQALADLNRSLGIEPGNAFALSHRGAVRRRAREDQLALEDLNQSLGLRPDDAFALRNRGAVLHHQGRDQQALDDLDRSLQIDPGNAFALQMHGLAVQRVPQHVLACQVSRDSGT
jgi:tetratricopeptide (TPR) repeat protein